MTDLYAAEPSAFWDPTPKARPTPGRHDIILLDSCIWIYLFEDHPQYAPLIDTMLRQWARESASLISSELSLVEIKTVPLRHGDESIAVEYQLYLNNFPGFFLMPIERAILNHAARLRARYRFKTPDAIIIATGLERGATLAVTNDLAWRNLIEIEVLCLADLPEGRATR
uniref:Predicted nucleic acid-binding protein, contains PIN domain n=1 Tax=Candidatus Kentrum sp. MB TaxID=2138164 RepID=A0A450XS20_9GAMM|nr:MAG: Predicted nucleic acid-binding protein, contains PIN domain [Candidatus Kentron sp. MB]VFK32079.1 MAG: Predicted nucleic acid-binding protein, contains PIN domain [Candidatus Kentron sp. MB]VFK75654.1 MAG: Predicted nucleic acid-binding protein, contains PIN domain [Candidatus Kentron sp. MB]